MRDLRFAFGDFRLRNQEVPLRADLLVQRELVILLRVFHQALGHHAVFVHLFGALHAELQKGHVRPFRIHFIALQSGLRGLQGCFRRLQVRGCGSHCRLKLHLVKIRQNLALLYPVAVIHIKPFHDATGFGFHFDFRERLNLSGGNHHARQVAAFRGRQLRGINGMVGT